jgi:hypothetical protein
MKQDIPPARKENVPLLILLGLAERN